MDKDTVWEVTEGDFRKVIEKHYPHLKWYDINNIVNHAHESFKMTGVEKQILKFTEATMKKGFHLTPKGRPVKESDRKAASVREVELDLCVNYAFMLHTDQIEADVPTSAVYDEIEELAQEFIKENDLFNTSPLEDYYERIDNFAAEKFKKLYPVGGERV